MSNDHPADNASAITDLFCVCGGLRKPTRGGTWICRHLCGQPATPLKTDLVFTMPQQEQHTRFLTEDSFYIPTTTVTCPECGHDKAEFKMQQLRSVDEPETRLYRCTDCGHTWREDG
jgi:DNA-directed RNA polymerase subunit M